MKKLFLYVFLGLLFCSNAFTETSNFEWINNQTEFKTSADLCFKDDKDRFKKLRAKSGALPFLGTEEDPNRPFNFWGWSEVQLLQLTMQVKAENEQFNILPVIGGGVNPYVNLLDVKSVALGPTTDSYMQILDDWKKIVTGDPGARYSRRVGSYSWQQKDGSKFLSHFFKMFGVTGSSLDGAKAIENFQSYQSQAKR